MFKIGTLVWVRNPQKPKKEKVKQGQKRWEKRATIFKVSTKFPGHYKIQWVDDGFLQKETAGTVSSRLYTVNELLSINPTDTVFIDSPEDYIKGLKEGDLDHTQHKDAQKGDNPLQTHSIHTNSDESEDVSDSDDDKDWQAVLSQKNQVSHNLEDHYFGYLETYTITDTNITLPHFENQENKENPPKFTEFQETRTKSHKKKSTPHTPLPTKKQSTKRLTPKTMPFQIRITPVKSPEPETQRETQNTTKRWTSPLNSKRQHKPNKRYLD